jgi:hypothetical protein
MRRSLVFGLLPGLAFIGTLEVMLVENGKALVTFDGKSRDDERGERERRTMVLTFKQVEEWTGVDLARHAA